MCIDVKVLFVLKLKRTGVYSILHLVSLIVAIHSCYHVIVILKSISKEKLQSCYPATRYSKEKYNLLPKATKKLLRYIMDLTEDGTKQTEDDITVEQENIDGFIDI